MVFSCVGKLLQIIASRFAYPRACECLYCGRHFFRFLPYRDGIRTASNFVLAIDVVGSDLERFSCPWCMCHDRERHLMMYMTTVGLLPDLRGKRVLHFAPEKHLSLKIAAASPDCYVKADLFPSAPDIQKVDLLKMPFEDLSFDLIIANHVMEHVGDDKLALAEIFRVLNPGGYAILQTPYSSVLENTWSDPGVYTEAMRFEAYGQEDHVRLYGRDIFQRFESVGLKSLAKSHKALLADVDCEKFGVNIKEPFFLFQKPLFSGQ